MYSLDSGFHFLDSEFHSLDSGFLFLHSGFRILDSGFQISCGFQIPENWPRIWILDSSDVWILDSIVWIPDCNVSESWILDESPCLNKVISVYSRNTIIGYFTGTDGVIGVTLLWRQRPAKFVTIAIYAVVIQYVLGRYQLRIIFDFLRPHWVVPEKIHTPPPPRGKFSLSEGGGGKKVLGCPKGGGGGKNVVKALVQREDSLIKPRQLQNRIKPLILFCD